MGLTALSKFTELAAGRVQVAARAPAFFRVAKGCHLLDPVPSAEPDTVVIELWRYAPALLSKDGHSVDPLSLHLSMRETNAERIEATLTVLLKGVQWLRD
jgi:hypothetical protein